jgi:hypothetical protein
MCYRVIQACSPAHVRRQDRKLNARDELGDELERVFAIETAPRCAKSRAHRRAAPVQLRIRTLAHIARPC